MNRPWAIIVVLVFCASSVWGMSGVCCCSTDAHETASDCDENPAIFRHHSSCDHGGLCKQDPLDGCLSLRCLEGLSSVALPELSSVFPRLQALALATLVIDSQDSAKTSRSDGGSSFCHSEEPVPLLLRTCSFLS